MLSSVACNMKALLAAILLCFSLTAGASPGKPYFVLDSTSATNSILPYGMKFWYNSNDLTNSPVAVWTDRIQGYNWWQTNVADQPTWDTNGVHFNGISQFLNASNGMVIVDQADATLTVFKFETTIKPQLLLGNELYAGQIFIGFGASDFFYNMNWIEKAVGPIGTSVMDFITAPFAVNDYGVYTNGVDGMSNRGVLWNKVDITRVGAGNTNAFAPNSFANVVLKEFIVWTNPYAPISTNYWTATTISNVHWYATNAWKYSP